MIINMGVVVIRQNDPDYKDACQIGEPMDVDVDLLPTSGGMESQDFFMEMMARNSGKTCVDGYRMSEPYVNANGNIVRTVTFYNLYA